MLTLVLGNKNYSSWSMRPWLAMKVAGIPFAERVISLDDAAFKSEIGKLSPAGKVPVLRDGELPIWESLAIIEYLDEKFPDAKLWPAGAAARAHARVISAEMHAGFAALRRHCPMNIRRAPKKRELTPDVQRDVSRIDAMWTDCRRRFGEGGPFLFGAFCAADAMYAPVVSRFRTYIIDVGAQAHAYMQAIMAVPAWAEWETAARGETWILPHNEVD